MKLHLELLPPCLMQHKVGGIKDAERVFMNGRAVIFRPLIRQRSGENARMAGNVRRADHEHEIVLVEVVTDTAGFRGRFGDLQDHARTVEPPDGRLIVQIKGADGFDLVIQPLHAQRLLRLIGKEVHDAAPAGELSALHHHRHAFITSAAELADEGLHIELCADLDHAALAFQLTGRGHCFIQAVRAEQECRGSV